MIDQDSEILDYCLLSDLPGVTTLFACVFASPVPVYLSLFFLDVLFCGRRLQLDTLTNASYNSMGAEVAQSVEQRTENPRVPSSILGLGTIYHVLK